MDFATRLPRLLIPHPGLHPPVLVTCPTFFLVSPPPNRTCRPVFCFLRCLSILSHFGIALPPNHSTVPEYLPPLRALKPVPPSAFAPTTFPSVGNPPPPTPPPPPPHPTPHAPFLFYRRTTSQLLVSRYPRIVFVFPRPMFCFRIIISPSYQGRDCSSSLFLGTQTSPFFLFFFLLHIAVPPPTESQTCLQEEVPVSGKIDPGRFFVYPTPPVVPDFPTFAL